MKDNMTWDEWERHLFTAKDGELREIDNLLVMLLGDITPEQYAEIKQKSKGPPTPKKHKT